MTEEIDSLLLSIIFDAYASGCACEIFRENEMRKQYFLIMSTIILVVILLGVSFAWYSSNTQVSAGPVTVTAAKPEASDVSFVYSETDRESGKLYISDVRILTDPYGRNKYQGETGIYMSGDKSGSVVDSYKADKDYAYTTYYKVTLNNSATSAKDVTFSLKNVNIYKSIANSSSPYTIEGINSSDYDYTLNNGTLTLTPSASGTSGTSGVKTYSVSGAFIYSENDTSSTKVGHLGSEVSADPSQFELGYALYETSYFSGTAIADTYEYSVASGTSHWTTNSSITIPSTVTSGAASTVDVIIAIKYFNGKDAFAYSSTDYMGAWFNFEIEVTEVK